MKRFFAIASLLVLPSFSFAQGMLDGLDSEMPEEKNPPVIGAFKSIRVLNGHNAQTINAKHLEFWIMHRFGALNSGAYNLWGLDGATIRLGLEYGVTDRLTIGAGRSSLQKTFDFYGKYRILSQTSGKGGMPVSVAGLFATTINTLDREREFPSGEFRFTDRLIYAGQLLISSKVTKAFSINVSPTLVHRNLVETSDHPFNMASVGVGGRLKFRKNMALSAEYFQQLGKMNPGATNAFSIGVDIETGGHAYQLFFSNTQAMNEQGFITATTGDWGKGDIFFGFNINRSFILSTK